jgi:hypothetical protein
MGIENLIEVNDSMNMNIVEPLKLTIIRGTPMPPYATQYELTGKELKISPKYDWQKEDSIEVQISQDVFDELSMIRIDSLKDYYANGCIMDGFNITVNLKNKTVSVSNYYQPQIGFIIETLNSSIPEKYKIPYDKKRLVRAQEKCPNIIEGYNSYD